MKNSWLIEECKIIRSLAAKISKIYVDGIYYPVMNRYLSGFKIDTVITKKLIIMDLLLHIQPFQIKKIKVFNEECLEFIISNTFTIKLYIEHQQLKLYKQEEYIPLDKDEWVPVIPTSIHPKTEDNQYILEVSVTRGLMAHSIIINGIKQDDIYFVKYEEIQTALDIVIQENELYTYSSKDKIQNIIPDLINKLNTEQNVLTKIFYDAILETYLMNNIIDHDILEEIETNILEDDLDFYKKHFSYRIQNIKRD